MPTGEPLQGRIGAPGHASNPTGWRPRQPHPGTRITCYRCSLPGLAGFASYRRGGTGGATMNWRRLLSNFAKSQLHVSIELAEREGSVRLILSLTPRAARSGPPAASACAPGACVEPRGFSPSLCRYCKSFAKSQLRVSIELAEREGFEPSIRLLTVYTLSRRAPSATRTPLRAWCFHPARSRPAGTRKHSGRTAARQAGAGVAGLPSAVLSPSAAARDWSRSPRVGTIGFREGRSGQVQTFHKPMDGLPRIEHACA